MGMFRKKNGSPNQSNSSTPQPSVRTGGTPASSARGRGMSQGLPPQPLETLPNGKQSTDRASSSENPLGERSKMAITETKDLESLNLERLDRSAQRDRGKNRSDLNLGSALPLTAEVAFSGIYSDRTHGGRGRPFKERGDAELLPLSKNVKQAQKLKPEHKSKVSDARGRLKWKDDEARKLNKCAPSLLCDKHSFHDAMCIIPPKLARLSGPSARI